MTVPTIAPTGAPLDVAPLALGMPLEVESAPPELGFKLELPLGDAVIDGSLPNGEPEFGPLGEVVVGS